MCVGGAYSCILFSRQVLCSPYPSSNSGPTGKEK